MASPFDPTPRISDEFDKALADAYEQILATGRAEVRFRSQHYVISAIIEGHWDHLQCEKCLRPLIIANFGTGDQLGLCPRGCVEPFLISVTLPPKVSWDE